MDVDCGRALVAALTDKGIAHQYPQFPDEGHGLARPQNREKFYAAAEAFLAEHLGGRSEDSPRPDFAAEPSG
ncbi:prolyl oligopeptidase family serine peptidase [Mycobacterium branderi]|nr:prolyl oligopeptidase family serine peptidase [Mycobacterium branderi]